MSETTNLKLFKHDNPATNENQFDVTKALNNNWDKIDDFAETTNTKITENQNNIKSLQTDNTTNKQDIATLKSDNTTNKANIKALQDDNKTNKDNIEELQQKNKELKAENERLNQDLNALPSNTAEGEYITLTDSADSRFNKFKIIGKSTQKTRSGKNKLDLRYLATPGNFIENIDIETGSFELVNCWSTTIMYAKHIVKLLKPDTRYKMIADVTLLEKPETLNSYNNHNRLLVLYNANAITTTVVILAVSNTTEKNNWQVNATKHIETNFTTPADLSNYAIRAYNYNITEGETDKASGKFKYENVMILEATEEDETFEQYGVSPSPEFSSKTRNVGDNINHFNKSTIKTGYYLDNTGAEIANINYAITDYIKVEENENYVYQGLNIESSFASKGAYYNSNKEFVDYFDLNAKNTLMKIPENVKYVRFTLRILNNNQDTFKFEKGTIATLYSPYNCGNVEIDINNNNLGNTDILASLKNSAVTINSKSSFTIDLSKGNVSALQNIDLLFGKNDKNKRYTLSYHLHQNNDSFRPGFAIIYSDGTKTGGGNSGDTDVDVTLNSTEGKTIERISIGWNTQTGGGIVTFSDIYLRLSDDTSEFQEQENQEFVFPLSEGQKMYEGSYLASDGIHHKRNTVSFNGTENWKYDSTYNRWHIAALVLYNSVVGAGKAELQCNYFKYSNSTQDLNKISDASSSDWYFYIEDKYLDGKTFPEWLQEKNSEGNPLTVEYNIVENKLNEYVEAYTDEQKQVYDELVKTAKTYKTVTNIFSTNEISPKFEVNYRRDIDTYIDNKLANVNEQILNIAGGN